MIEEPMYDYECPHCHLDVVDPHYPDEEIQEIFGNRKVAEFKCQFCGGKIVGEYDENTNWYTLRKPGNASNNYVEME